MQLPVPLVEFLQKPNFAVLATIAPSGRPQATPVWFLLADGHILINTSRGRVKLRNLLANPQAAITIVDRDNPYRYVQLRGEAVKFDSANGARDIDRLSMRYHGHPYRYPPTDAPADRISIFIQPRAVNAMGIK